MSKRKNGDLSIDEQQILKNCHLRLLSCPEEIARCDQAIVEHHYLHQVTLVGVGDQLGRSGDLESIGGPQALGDVFDLEATGAEAREVAKRVRRRSLERTERLLHSQAANEGSRPEGQTISG